MINSVRNTVLSVLNKNNYGYISPQDFNLYAKQAQLDIFEDYFYQYNYQIMKENARQSGIGYANITEGYLEVIEFFSVTKFLSHNTDNSFFTPSATTTGEEYYYINKVLCYTEELSNGTVDSLGVNQLNDSTADFVTDKVKVGDKVWNTTTNASASVTSVSANQLVLSANIFTVLAEGYVVYDNTTVKDAEKVSQTKIRMLTNSNLTAPTKMFPAYTLEGNLFNVFPSSINKVGGVECQYVRYPKDPKWTFVTLTGGEPSFNQSQPDYQDFELPLSDEPNLVMRILQYAGMSIREMQAVQFAQTYDGFEKQEEQ
jgi:hypothetical protein